MMIWRIGDVPAQEGGDALWRGYTGEATAETPAVKPDRRLTDAGAR
ncbi:MAG: hypothetical protein WBQ24_11920 [Xanthobacteraceae bacterium]